MAKTMFDYGRSANASNSKYKYYYFEQNLQIGSYPIENFDGIKKFNEPKVLIGGKQAWGEISYESPLTTNQLLDYGLKSVEEEELMQMRIDQAQSQSNMAQPKADVKPVDQESVENVESKKSEPVKSVQTEVKNVVLSNVPDSMVYPTKNPKYMVLSLRTKLSDNGYGNIVLPSDSFTKSSDGSYSVILGKEGSWRNMAVKSGNEFIREKRNLSEIVSLYESSKMFQNVEQSDKQSNVHIETEIKAETDSKTNSTVGKAKTVYLNGVLSNWIRDTKNPLFKSVSIPYAESESGYGRLLIESNKIFQSTNLQTNVPVPGHMNVNLGPGDGMIDISIKKNGVFEKKYLKCSELADEFRASRKAYADSKVNALHAQFNDDVIEMDDEAIFE